MITDFMIDLNTGSAFFGDTNVNSINDKKKFVSSSFYKEAKSTNRLNKLSKSQFYIDGIDFWGNSFGVEFDFSLEDNSLPNIYLLWKNGEYYKNSDEWGCSESIMTDEVLLLVEWFTQQAKISFNKTWVGGYIWEFKWGKISISYEMISYNCGIFISWNKIA